MCFGVATRNYAPTAAVPGSWPLAYDQLAMLKKRKKSLLVLAVGVAVALPLAAQGPRRVPIGDWPEARGPNRDGVSLETGLLEMWTLKGDGMLWRAP